MNPFDDSDFDPTSLFSDFPLPSDNHLSQDVEQDHETFSDEIEAIHEVSRDRTEALTRNGVVIQHRLWNKAEFYRSSSLPPPVSPTPVRIPDVGHYNSTTSPPSTSKPKDIISIAESFLQSSPPAMELPPKATVEATQKTDSIPSNDLLQLQKPNFSTPLKGGLFSKNFARKDKSLGQLASFSNIESNTRNEGLVPFLTNITSQESIEHERMFTVVSSRGTITKVGTRKPFVTYDEISQEATARNSKTKKNFYGVDISNILDNLEHDKDSANQGLAETSNISSKIAQTTAKRLLWTEKYRAKRFTDLVGDERTHRHVMHWLKEWDSIVFPSGQKLVHNRAQGNENQEKKKILLLHGPPGLGKTTLAHVAARQAGYEPLEINASDDRSGDIVRGKIKDMLTIEGVKSCGLKSGKSQSVVVKPVCIVIDEIDGVSGAGGEAGFIKALVDLILQDQKLSHTQSNSNAGKGKNKQKFKLLRPIIAVCNDLYAPSLKPLRTMAEVIQMRIPPKRLIEDRLEWIFEKEGFVTEDGAIRKLLEFSSGSSGNLGDMRGALVSAEWISTKLRQLNTKPERQRSILSRRFVENEFVGSNVAQGDGKRIGGNQFGIKDAVEAVFHLGKDHSVSGKSVKKSSAIKIQELVESLGEFDRITMDCFTTYATRNFHDDSRLSKLDSAYEWLWFSDVLSSRVFQDQFYELAAYLSYPVVAFHQMFASTNPGGRSREDQSEELSAFSGPSADWEAREATKENISILQSIHSGLVSIRLAQTFKSSAAIVTELAPYVNNMLCPQINPVIVGGSSYGMPSVRKETEKKLVRRAVNAMEATGIQFEKIKIDMGPGEVIGTGWAYRMEPPVDSVVMYSTYCPKIGDQQPVRYAVRQVLDTECRKSCLIREKILREARMGELTPSYIENEDSKLANEIKGKSEQTNAPLGLKIKRDFFGREIIDSGNKGGQHENSSRKRRKIDESMYTDKDVWVSFHEGFSNAVKKGIRLAELMDGLL